MLAVGLGAGETPGLAQVADFVATVLRIKTPEGTLVVKVEDPEVKVRIDGEDVVITGAGPQEVRLRPGMHRLQATKNGQLVRDELVTITRDGKDVVNVALEPVGVAADARLSPSKPTRPQGVPNGGELTPARYRVVQPDASLGNLDSEVWSVAFSPNGETLVWGGKGVGLIVTEPPGQSPRRIETADNGGFTQMAFLPDGKRLVTGGWDQTVKLWNADSFALERTLKGHTDAVRSVAVSPDGTRIASGSYDRTARVWEANTGKLLLEIPPQDLPVNRVAFKPDGKTLLVATGDWKAYWHPGAVALWDVASGNRTEVLRGHSGQILGLAPSPDGRMIATGGLDGILLWGPDDTAEQPLKLRHDDPSVNFLAFSPDGKTLASAHYQGDVVLWDVSTRRRIAVLKGHRGVVFSLAFAPDGATLASTGIDGMLKLWNVAPVSTPWTGRASSGSGASILKK